MKVTALAALSVLAVLPAEAAQRHQVNGSSALTCDNDGHCTTFNVSALTSGLRKTRPAIKNAAAATQRPSPALDANSNSDSKKTTATIQPPSPVLDGNGNSESTKETATGQNQSPAPDASSNSDNATDTATAVQHQPPAVEANGDSDKTKDTATAVQKPLPAGVVVSRKTGARARVGVAYAARFQAYIDDLETNHGARVLFMGGIRPGRCSSSSEHPCGKALDVCQHRRGVVDSRCNLPGRVALGQIAASHGLFEGGRWCDSDYGHAQIGVTAAACGDSRFRIVQQQ